MRTLRLLLLFILVITSSSRVVELRDTDMEEYLQKNNIVMVLFYAIWCGHCNAFKPDFAKTALKAEEQGKPYTFAQIEMVKETKMKGKYGVTSYPTLKLFVYGKAFDYDGDRRSDAIIEFIDKKTSPATSYLGNAKEIEELKKQKKGLKAILASDSMKDINEYSELARDNDDFAFYITSEEAGKAAFPELDDYPSVVVLKEFDDQPSIMTGAIEKETFEEFLRKNSFPMVSHFTKQHYDTLFGSGKSHRRAVCLFRVGGTKKAKLMDEEFRKLAEANSNSSDFIYILSDLKQEYDKKAVEYLGIENNHLPVLEVIEKKSDGETYRYRYKGNLTNADQIAEFMESAKAGEIERFLKSEDIPKVNPGPVYKVVGKTFDKEVMESTDDVFVKFYAPWCGHCKKLAPIYKELAKVLKKDNPHLKIVEVDSTKNDIPSHNIHGFPTLKLFTAKDKSSPEEYHGERTVEALANFLKEKCSFEVKVDPAELKKADDAFKKEGEEKKPNEKKPNEKKAGKKAATKAKDKNDKCTGSNKCDL